MRVAPLIPPDEVLLARRFAKPAVGAGPLDKFEPVVPFSTLGEERSDRPAVRGADRTGAADFSRGDI